MLEVMKGGGFSYTQRYTTRRGTCMSAALLQTGMHQTHSGNVAENWQPDCKQLL